WEQKAAAIACYPSQFVTGRPAPKASTDPPAFLDRLRDEAAYWGKSIGTAYGEPIAMREPLGLRAMGELV
ncbi:MAG: bacillithiol biosynthesis deacetylase BshB1, partial [Planctomycetota bacterium]